MKRDNINDIRESSMKKIKERNTKRLNEVKFGVNPNYDPDDEKDYFDNEYPDPETMFQDFDDMLDQLYNYFQYKKHNDKSRHFSDMGIDDLEWNEEIATLNAVLGDDKKTTVYMNPYFAELLLDNMEAAMEQPSQEFKENPDEPKEYVYFKLFHGAILYAGYLALVADQLDRVMTTDAAANVTKTAARFSTAFNEAIASFPNHVWEIKKVRELMKKYWPQI